MGPMAGVAKHVSQAARFETLPAFFVGIFEDSQSACYQF
jgi:hypothetical protein